MRQAGRYLPEYLAFRKEHSLLSCFHEPDLAACITHMPLKRFDLDAAILFSDLLVLVEIWGKTLLYPEVGGPSIQPALKNVQELHVPTKQEVKEKLSYVFDTIALLLPKLSIPLIGFCGAPFTLLCYLLQGKSGSGFSEVRNWIDHRKEEFLVALDIVCETCILFATLQMQAGVSAFQVFDSWASLLSKEEFSLYVLPYWKRMKEELSYLDVPVIFFSRANSLYPELISSFSPHCISFDEGRPLAELRAKVPSHIAVQGNFSQELLLNGSILEVKEAALKMVRSVALEKGIVWNLGHGVLPKTPLENVEALLKVFATT
jgi:uroporphyrinogen decarboxylase